ncbi:MAG TPA: hypothetical protein VL283_01455 [Candidatus Baltobacteraceae bacterium]|nr:hypothetical protein [Candidatus Baltobacteraceae bacterium]
MRWIDVRQLKNLRRFPVPPEVLAAGRVKLIAVIDASPMAIRRSAWFMSAAWRPVMAAMVVIVVATTGGGTFALAHDALPGERLYVVKLAGEELHERMTLTPERRFVVQAAHASRRLEETERLLELQGLGGADRAARVRRAMDRYEGHVFTMDEIAVKMEADPEKPSKGRKARAAAEGVFDLHARLIESATRAEPAMASLMLDPTDATFTLEDDVYSSIPADDGGTDEGSERHRRERTERINESLKRMRADLEGRRTEGSADGNSGGDGAQEDGDGLDASQGTDFRYGTGGQNPLEIKP